MKKLIFIAFAAVLLIMQGCGMKGEKKPQAEVPIITDSTRIVSLNGTISEILVELGLADNIVGTDVTSTYPTSIQQKPKVGHNRNISAEGVLSLRPDLVLATESEMKPQLVNQLKSAGIKVFQFGREYSVQGTRDLIARVADTLQLEEKAKPVLEKLNSELNAALISIDTTLKPKVLFIYARGTGTMMVAGEGTQVEKVIQLAGGQNAVKGFADFKPLTPEALVKANPDVILMFTSGLESLGGMEGLLNVQGIAQTNAGKNKRVVEMDGLLLTGFGPRLGAAIAQLSQKIH